MNINPQKSIRSQMTEYFRNAIRTGKFKAGDKIPSARVLAQTFGTAEANVHHALTILVKEGLVMRRPKIGTVVTDQKEKLTCAAIYLSWFYIQRGESFTRILIEKLENKLAEHGIHCIVIYDTPAQNGLKRLEELAESRQIQGVIVRSLLPEEYPFFSHLPVPFSAVTSMRIRNKVSFFSKEFALQLGMYLQEHGASKIGILSGGSFGQKKSSLGNHEFNDFFLKHLQELGFEIRPEWIYDASRIGAKQILDSSTFAFYGFESIWNTPERPDTLLVFSDDMVCGLAMAFYRLQIRIPEDIRLYIHKTKENELILPFACTLIENRIDELACCLVEQLINQSRGSRAVPKTLHTELIPWI